MKMTFVLKIFDAFDTAILCRSNDFGVITISGLRNERAIWRRSRWK